MKIKMHLEELKKPLFFTQKVIMTTELTVNNNLKCYSKLKFIQTSNCIGRLYNRFFNKQKRSF